MRLNSLSLNYATKDAIAYYAHNFLHTLNGNHYMKTIFIPFILASFIPFHAFATLSDANISHSQVAVNEKLSAIEVILEDHKHIKSLIAEVEKNLNNDTKSHDSFQKLKDFVEKHEAMEQKIWYPELSKNDKLKAEIDKLKEQEEKAGDEFKKIDGINDKKEWKTEVKKLIKAVKNHAKEEETKLFPKVKKEFNKTSLQEIGGKMQEYKKDHS